MSTEFSRSTVSSVPPTSSSDDVSPGEKSPFVMVPLPDTGRIFTGRRLVRLGDVDSAGRLRLDALTRYTQDVSNDDTTDAGLVDDLAFVVRRTTVDVHRSGVFGEGLTIATFCGRLGKRWAERRLVVTGSEGARYDVATLWVHIDTDSGRPRPLSDDFLTHYGEAAQGRAVSARQELRPPDKVDAGPLTRSTWPLRVVDFDTFGHMNNAAYWAVIEEQWDADPVDEPLRTTIEYGAGITPADEVTIVSGVDHRGRRLLWWEVGGQSVASASVEALATLGSVNTVDR